MVTVEIFVMIDLLSRKTTMGRLGLVPREQAVFSRPSAIKNVIDELHGLASISARARWAQSTTLYKEEHQLIKHVS